MPSLAALLSMAWPSAISLSDSPRCQSRIVSSSRSRPALGPARMHADFLEVEQACKQAHVPVGGAARADVGQHLAVLARQVFGADGGHGAGAHVGDGGGVEDGAGHAGRRIEQVEDAYLR